MQDKLLSIQRASPIQVDLRERRVLILLGHQQLHGSCRGIEFDNYVCENDTYKNNYEILNIKAEA